MPNGIFSHMLCRQFRKGISKKTGIESYKMEDGQDTEINKVMDYHAVLHVSLIKSILLDYSRLAPEKISYQWQFV